MGVCPLFLCQSIYWQITSWATRGNEIHFFSLFSPSFRFSYSWRSCISSFCDWKSSPFGWKRKRKVQSKVEYLPFFLSHKKMCKSWEKRSKKKRKNRKRTFRMLYYNLHILCSFSCALNHFKSKVASIRNTELQVMSCSIIYNCLCSYFSRSMRKYVYVTVRKRKRKRSFNCCWCFCYCY